MKYISTLIFILALIYTWKVVQQDAPIKFETHAAIQLKLVDVIRQSILEIKPSAQNIEIIDVSTEPVNDHTLKAYFSYKFQEPDTASGEWVEQQINGEAQLRKSGGPDFTEEKWVMENVITQTGTMNFKNGILITPETNSDTSKSEINENPTTEIETDSETEAPVVHE